MSHRDNTRCSYPSGIPQGLGSPCQMLSVTQEIPVVLRIGVRVHAAEPKTIFVSCPQELQEGQVWNQGVRVQVTTTARSQLCPRHELELAFLNTFSPGLLIAEDVVRAAQGKLPASFGHWGAMAELS